MNPILKKFSVFTEFTKYEYRDISKPEQSFTEKIKSSWYIFSKWKYKTTYIKDLNSLTQKSSKEVPKWENLKYSLSLYKACEVLIGAYGIHSIYWHYKNKYFNSGRKLLEIYIITKIIFNIFFFNGINFFSLKTLSDPILYEYFSKKEEEWEENLNKRRTEIKDLQEDIEMRIKIKEKAKN